MKACKILRVLPLLLAVAAPTAATCDRPLVLGWEPWAPFQMTDSDGRPSGFDIELMREVVDRMDCDLELRKVPWERHKADLREGTIDLAAGIAYLEEREEWLRYSEPWRSDVISLWVLADELESHDFSELTGIAGRDFRLGIRRGYHYGGHYDQLVEQPGIEGQTQAVDLDEQNIEKLLRGRIDGFIADVANVAPLLRQRDLQDRIVRHPAPVYDGASFVVFSRASIDEALVEAFDAALAAVRDDGTYDEIHARYLE